MNNIALPLAELKPALTGLGKVLAKRAALPVLSHIKVERTKDGWIALTATDLDSFATVRMEQPSTGEAVSLLVSYEDLQKVTKSCGKTDTIVIRTPENLSDLSVTVETKVGDQTIEHRCGSLPVAEFPPTPRLNGEPCSLSEPVRDSLHEALECASEDATRLILNGAYIDVSQKCHTVVGTNGTHLYSANSFTLPIKDSVLIPSHPFLGFKDFNADGEWQMRTLEEKDFKQVQLTSRRWRFIIKQHDGNYPDWRQVVPTEFLTTIVVQDADVLQQTIQRLPDHDKTYHTIGLVVENGVFILLAKPDREAEWMSVVVSKSEATGKDQRVFINREYLTKALRFGLTQIDITDHLGPIRFSNEGRQLIAMPVRGAVSDEPVKPTAAETSAVSTTAVTTETSAVSTTETTTVATTAATTPERSKTMAEENNGSKPSPNGDTIDSQLDQCIEELDTLKESLQKDVSSITSLKAKLKLIQREQKTSAKELTTIRQTIKSLQGLKV